jgi:hypothetical protein
MRALIVAMKEGTKVSAVLRQSVRTHEQQHILLPHSRLLRRGAIATTRG